MAGGKGLGSSFFFSAFVFIARGEIVQTVLCIWLNNLRRRVVRGVYIYIYSRTGTRPWGVIRSGFWGTRVARSAGGEKQTINFSALVRF